MNDTTKAVKPSVKNPQKRQLTGTVVSTGMKQTVVVEVVRFSRHPLYKKMVKRTKNFAAHNETEGIAVGDLVTIAETRPISKTKHFKVVGKATR